MTTKKALEKIAALVAARRVELGYAQQPFAKLIGISYNTLRSVEEGLRVPWDTNQRKLEDGLGWRQGVIQEIVNGADTIPMDSLTADYMSEGAGEPTWMTLDAEETNNNTPVTRAGQLSNEELIGELAYRLRNKTIHHEP